jgi:DNA-binding NarL/FixJ family response regulator
MDVTRITYAMDAEVARYQGTTNTMRLIIIDDHTPFREALARMLEQVTDIDIVGQAGDGKEGLKVAAELKPDTVLVDFSMPVLDGLAVTRQLKAWPKPPRVVMMSFHAEPEYREMALATGADIFITKADLHKDLVPVLEGFIRPAEA